MRNQTQRLIQSSMQREGAVWRVVLLVDTGPGTIEKITRGYDTDAEAEAALTAARATADEWDRRHAARRAA